MSDMELEADAETLAAALSFVDEALTVDAVGSGGVRDAVSPSVSLGSLVTPSNVCGEWSPSGGGGALEVLDVSTEDLPCSGGGGDLSARHAALNAECSPTPSSSAVSQSVGDNSRDSVKTKPAKKPTRKRPADYNPNRAREEQRKEVQALRSEVRLLEGQLAVLSEPRPRHCRATVSGLNEVDESGSIPSKVWKALAERQLQKRMASTSENTRLKASVQANQVMVARLSRLIRSHNAEKATQEFCIVQSRRLSELAQYQMDPSTIQQLMAGVAECYDQVDSVVHGSSADVSKLVNYSPPEMLADSCGNVFMRSSGSKIFPYSVQETAAVAWAQLAALVRPNARCFVHDPSASPGDIVVTRCATELHMDGSKVVVFGWQVKRRYVEADRVVVVWQSLMDPLEFRGKPLKGPSFQERGFYVIHSPPQLPKGYSLLESCYQMAPRSPMQSVQCDATSLAVVEFVANWMAKTIPANHQIIEDGLFERSLAVKA